MFAPYIEIILAIVSMKYTFKKTAEELLNRWKSKPQIWEKYRGISRTIKHGWIFGGISWNIMEHLPPHSVLSALLWATVLSTTKIVQLVTATKRWLVFQCLIIGCCWCPSDTSIWDIVINVSILLCGFLTILTIHWSARSISYPLVN